ncbi:hypothetical protein JOQ06_006273 [Pogonophryne albipinna]|uniref:Uncharacterized protein n=1 Tax=Pogonophryne albipinna TaxID=1090488 RepID=A0AAD6FS35_9TELE|nr:hypothetical protein JOQ06_006273 [Pogonophryne albipinna]
MVFSDSTSTETTVFRLPERIVSLSDEPEDLVTELRGILRPLQVATDTVAGKLSSTLSWVKNSVSHTVSQMASQVATPTSLQTTATSSSTSLSSAGLSPSSPALLSPDDVELLAKLEQQNK